MIIYLQLVIQKITDFILHENTWQDAGLLEKLFKYAGDKLCKNCCDAWIQGKVIPLAVLEKMQTHLKTKNPLSEVEKNIQLLSMAVDEKDHKHANDSKSQPVTITTGQGRVVALNEFGLQSIVWEEGLKSYHDLHVLAGSGIDTAKHAMKSANILLKSNLLFTGSSVRYGDYQKYISLKENRTHLEEIKKQIESNQTAIKIIAPKDWDDNVKQLLDYKYRPDLRKDKKELKEKKDIYKLLPGAEKAIKYEYKKKPKKKVYTQTKKTAMTFLSGDYSTAVFGEHDPTRPLVGLLFDLDLKEKL